jgi:hypothetical protein
MSNLKTLNTLNTKAYSLRLPIILFQVLLVLIFTLTFVLSYVVAPFHVGGDQAHYVRAYSAMAGLGFVEALNEYPTIIHTAEPVHLLIIWFFSSLGVEKNVLMATANAFLAVLFAKFLRQKGAGFWMVVWITFSAYYLQTMFFTLERTKFAFIFMLLYLLTQRRWWILVAVFTHSMMLIPLALNLIGQKLFGPKPQWHLDPLRSYLIKIVQALLSIAFLLLLADNLGIHLYYKFLAYFNENLSNEAFEGWPLIALCCLTLMTSQNKRVTVLFYLGLLLLAMLMGSSRINMIGYFAYLYFSNFQHQAFKFSITMIGLYLLYKTVVYLANIYHFGG